MQPRVLVAAVVVFTALLPVSGAAQSPAGEVTFEVPVTLTRLEPDITKVRVKCSITSRVLTGNVGGLSSKSNVREGQVEIAVTGGEVRTSATVVVAIPAGALEKFEAETADFRCSIDGYSVGTRAGTSSKGAGWDVFDPKQVKPSFQITPAPVAIVGKFPWLGGEAEVATPKL